MKPKTVTKTVSEMELKLESVDVFWHPGGHDPRVQSREGEQMRKILKEADEKGEFSHGDREIGPVIFVNYEGIEFGHDYPRICTGVRREIIERVPWETYLALGKPEKIRVETRKTFTSLR